MSGIRSLKRDDYTTVRYEELMLLRQANHRLTLMEMAIPKALELANGGGHLEVLMEDGLYAMATASFQLALEQAMKDIDNDLPF